jgi:hypothetical protein
MMLRRDPSEFTFKPTHGSYSLSFLSGPVPEPPVFRPRPANQCGLDSREIASSLLKNLAIDETDCVVMGDVLLTQEPYSGALALIEHGHEKIGASRLTV